MAEFVKVTDAKAAGDVLVRVRDISAAIIRADGPSAIHIMSGLVVWAHAGIDTFGPTGFTVLPDVMLEDDTALTNATGYFNLQLISAIVAAGSGRSSLRFRGNHTFVVAVPIDDWLGPRAALLLRP